MTTQGHVLLSVEAEAYVEHLEEYSLPDIGSSRWFQQHEHLEKLNMQAVVNAAAKEDEFVKDFFISHDKITLLIKDLLMTEIWKQHIFPELIDMEFKPKTTFPLYMVLYHEATVVNLLETMMFYKETCEVADDSVLDLVDYCYRKLCFLAAKGNDDENEDFLPESGDVTKKNDVSNMEEKYTKFIEGKWQEVSFEDSLKLTKTEG
ncbi:hypothetical protein RRG08_017698, partial [Elysia crispata]